MNQMRAELYRRLMEAQERIAHMLYKHNVSHDDVLVALDAVDEELSEAERRDDLYLSALEHYVGALGGRIEIRAVFNEGEVLIRRAPGRRPLVTDSPAMRGRRQNLPPQDGTR